MMAIGCDLDLRLRLGSSSDGGSNESSSTASCSRMVEEFFGKSGEYQQQQQQKMTIFNNGRICVCDVTEIKARGIISMAKREMDDEMKKRIQHQQTKDSSLPQNPLPSSHYPEQFLINPELPMKRSLQRFLQKRKSRLDALSPYTSRIPCPLSSPPTKQTSMLFW